MSLQNYLKCRHREPHVGRDSHKLLSKCKPPFIVFFNFLSVDPDSNSPLSENNKNNHSTISEGGKMHR